ncbi:uncharacterized protein LOC133735577 [Rosa rugosa]|uniref:uncharacterized protein LOC133735577 n=1 Tax=Rosa rugosa TaxID=74645 RepID=UPI002B4095B2|nr:uncharacterized protein LOC133735577 [Rosa rugosa]
MADDASELEAGSEGSDILTKSSAEFATKFKKAFDASKDTLQNSVVCRLAKNKEPQGMCILGPHYYVGMPLAVKEVLEGSLVDTSCLAYGASWSTWSSEFKLPRVWPKLTPEWSKWVPRMEHFFAQKWKDYGIYDSIKMTEQEIHMDRPLLAASLCFWSSATNTINLPLGPMTPTLLDMAAIFGLRPNGEAVCATAKFPSSFHASLKPKAIKNDKKAKDDAEAKAKQLLNYSTFYATHAVDEAVSETGRQPPKQHEHAAFLLYWLCKFVFCSKSNKCTFEFAGIAEALSMGRPLALGSFVLARLYRALRNAVIDNMNLDIGGPLWMFQVWIQTYFHELRPTCPPLVPTMTLGRQIIALGARTHSAAQCFAFFYSKKTMSKDEFAICYSRDHPSCLEINISKPWDKKFELDVILTWGSFLISRDLNYGLKGTVGRYGVEVYLPNLVARQFGFVQSCPALFLMSKNHFSSWRDGFTRTSQCSAIGNYYVEQFGKFERSGFKPRCPDYRATPKFQAWWSTFIVKKLGEDLANTQRVALRGLPDLLGPKESNGKKKVSDSKSKTTKGSGRQGQTLRKRGPTIGHTRDAKKAKKSSDMVQSSVSDPTDNMVSEDICFEANMDDGHNTLAENETMSEAEDMAETGDTSTNSVDSAASEGSSENQFASNGQERDGRIDHSLPLPESSMVEIDMDDLGENQFPNTSIIGQHIAILDNPSTDVEEINVLGREELCNPPTLVWVGESLSSSTLELALLNPTETNPPMLGTLTSPPTEGMSHSEQAVVCAQSSAKLVDRTVSDLGLELLHFLDTLDNAASPVEEKLETTETKKALETVRQFLGCDVRTVTEASFLAIKEAVDVLISANHLSQEYAYEVHARLAVVNFSLSPCLEAQKEFETGEKLISEYEDIRQSTDLGQLHKLKASLDKGRQKVLDLKKQLAEAEQVKVTSATIRTIVPQQDLTRYSLILSSVKSYNKKRGILKRKVDQGMQDLENVKEALRSLLPTD